MFKLIRLTEQVIGETRRRELFVLKEMAYAGAHYEEKVTVDYAGLQVLATMLDEAVNKYAGPEYEHD